MIPVVFGLIEVALVDYLAAALTARGETVPVYNNVPRERPPEYVLALRVGGAQSNLVMDRPRIVAECCAEVGVRAAELGALVRALITATAPGWVGEIWVDRVVDLGLVYSPDPGTNLPRYLVTAELHVMGAALT
ncbi:hypothetical protein [Nocardia sp. CA-290969]|uniref:hypothetical protein n=1 Tax=Nocardia sp. CA-290969 TaxID=3239986 RepID=UPI003D92D986